MTLNVPGPTARIDICYTGQLLGAVQSLPRLATAIKAQPGALLIDTGNVMSDERQSDGVIGDVYRHLGYAALVLGPSDARRGADRLDALAGRGHFSLLASDLTRPDPFSIPCLSHVRDEVRVAMLALTGCEWNGEPALPPGSVLDRYLAELRSQHDFIVLVSHLGFEVDRRLAQSHDGVDAIISGVAGEAFDTTMRIGRTILAPPAGSCRVGVLSLERPTEWVIRPQSET